MSSVFEIITDEEYTPSDISLDSFELHDELNPLLWDGDELDLEVRRQLLIIARDFISGIGLKYIHPKDIIITGSAANYNWSKKYSDIDLHILVDFSKSNVKQDILKKFFDLQKKDWNDKHSDITIKGFPVELYVQDTKEKHASSGVYSILRDEWIVKPDKEKFKQKYDEDTVRTTASDFMNDIDELCDEFSEDRTPMELEHIYDKSVDIFNDIKQLRQSDLSKRNSEMSDGNIIFKVLRRTGYINKILTLRTDCYNAMNSIR